MKRLNVFATPEQIERIKIAQKTSGMLLSGGAPISDPLQTAHAAALERGLPEIPGYYGIDLRTGEFVSA